MNRIKKEFYDLKEIVKSLDKKTAAVLIASPVILTLSWYYTSRMYFDEKLSGYFSNYEYSGIYKYIYWFAGDFLTLFVLTSLIIRLLLKEKLRDYGIKKGEWKIGLQLSAIFIAVMIPLIWIATSRQGFILNYPMLAETRDSWNIFFIFEAGLFFYIFAWEFIWRGFILFGLKEKFGYYAILIQTVPFVMLHLGKPPLEAFGSIFGGLALGILAYRTKSIYYCFVTHAAVMFTMDIVSVLRYRAGDFGLGLNSMLAVIKIII